MGRGADVVIALQRPPFFNRVSRGSSLAKSARRHQLELVHPPMPTPSTKPTPLGDGPRRFSERARTRRSPPRRHSHQTSALSSTSQLQLLSMRTPTRSCARSTPHNTRSACRLDKKREAQGTHSPTHLLERGGVTRPRASPRLREPWKSWGALAPSRITACIVPRLRARRRAAGWREPEPA